MKKDSIRDILHTGLAVQYLVRRHGLEDEEVAYEIEAALIDAYPGMTDLAGAREQPQGLAGPWSRS